MKKRPALLSAIGFTFVLLAILGISLTVQAASSKIIPARPQALLLNDDFNYGTTAMSLTIASNGNWVNHSGASPYVGYTTTSLSMTGYGSSGVGGAATISTSGSEDVNRTFITQTSGTVYFAALVNVSAAGSGTYFMHLKDASTGFRARVFARNDAGVLRFGLDITGTGTYATNAYSYTTTYLLVTKYNLDTGATALYVLDAFSSSEPATPVVSFTTGTTVTVQAVALRQASGGPSAIIDGVRVGNTWAEAVGYAPPPEADLGVAKSGPTTASAGDPINYTINISNSGTTTATTTIVTDTLPVEVSFVTYTTALPVSFSQPNAQTLVWDLGDVANGASGSISVQGMISASLGNGSVFTNSVTASTTATETNTTNNSRTATTLIGAPDLVLVKTGPSSANAGDQVAYTLDYSNTGDLNATGAVLIDQLPAGLTYVSDSLGGVQVGGRITWTLGTVPVNATGSVVLTATAVSAGDQANVATITGSPADSNPQDNTSVFTTTVLGSDPFVSKTGRAVVFGGELISYTIVYGNHGAVAADVTLTDTLPISFTTSDIAFDDSGLNWIDGTNTRSWTATLAAGDRFTFTLALTVPTAIANNTRITNTIEITTTSLGNNPIDDLSSASSTVYQIVPISAARAGANGQVFGVEGSVIYAPGTLGTAEWGVQDASGGISVFYTTPPAPSVTLGDHVRLVATRGAFSGQAQLAAPVYYFANLGAGPLVTPKPYTTGQVASGASEGWLVVVTGTVSGLPACTPGTANYQFNLNDGSGSAVVFVDKDTLVDVCTQGVVNGDRIVVTGFSTQFNGTFEIKPRFPADVKRLFDVTFVYNDLEDAVNVGEDVQLRGDFTNWGTNPITMAHDAGYTVFSVTVTLPTTATQSYKYYVNGLSGNAGWDMLNTDNRSFAPVAGVTLLNEYRNVSIGWGNLNGPTAQTINLGSPTASIDGQLYVQEVTNPAGPGRGLKAEVGYGNTANPASWSWFSMAYASQTGNNDVYAGVITPTAGGVYSYATRYNGNWGVGNPNSQWVYADLDGIPFSLDKTGVLTVTAPLLAINKAVATTHNPAELGDVATYTFTLSNTGDGIATSVLITDVLPAALNFGGFVQQNGATYGSGAITWSGSLNVGASATVIFTATVKNDKTLYGTDVMNTVQFTSGNGGNGSANIAFAIVKRYFVYMPLIQR